MFPPLVTDRSLILSPVSSTGLSDCMQESGFHPPLLAVSASFPPETSGKMQNKPKHLTVTAAPSHRPDVYKGQSTKPKMGFKNLLKLKRHLHRHPSSLQSTAQTPLEYCLDCKPKSDF